MTAIETLLDGLIDYAGIYPPAALDLETAARNYMRYRSGRHSRALGRFVMDGERLGDLRRAAEPSAAAIPLTVCIASANGCNSLLSELGPGMRADSFEIKGAAPDQIASLIRGLPPGAIAYFEVPLESDCSRALDAVCAVGARVKLRMGGVVAGAFPSALATVAMLRALADRHLTFKATAGLHHPLRSRHPFAGAADSPVGEMHGFLNLFCAASFIYFGGSEEDACDLLNETDRAAFRIASDSISCGSFSVNIAQIQEVRNEFFISFGSCSFEEPIADLEALGWL
jgi:hypothetical protein